LSDRIAPEPRLGLSRRSGWFPVAVTGISGETACRAGPAGDLSSIRTIITPGLWGIADAESMISGLVGLV
jgi:hypothetical protein